MQLKNSNQLTLSKHLAKKNPKIDFKAIIISEVPIAFFIPKLVNTTKAGIIRNPPPAPTKPVTAPTKRPSINING